MVQMHLVQVVGKLRTQLFFLLFTTSFVGFSQKYLDTPPKLKSGTSINSLIKLGRIEEKDYSICTFSFRVTDKGLIDTVFLTGTCDYNVQKKMIEQIKETSGKWFPRQVNGKPAESKLFKLPFILIKYFDSNTTCDKSKIGLMNEIKSQHDTIFELVHSDKKYDSHGDYFIELKDSYVFPISILGAIR